MSAQRLGQCSEPILFFFFFSFFCNIHIYWSPLSSHYHAATCFQCTRWAYYLPELLPPTHPLSQHQSSLSFANSKMTEFAITVARDWRKSFKPTLILWNPFHPFHPAAPAPLNLSSSLNCFQFSFVIIGFPTSVPDKFDSDDDDTLYHIWSDTRGGDGFIHSISMYRGPAQGDLHCLTHLRHDEAASRQACADLIQSF